MGISTQVETTTLSRRADWESVACQQTAEHTADWESARHRIGLGPKREKIKLIFRYTYMCVSMHYFSLVCFCVCLLCAGVKTDTKRDVALQGEKHKKMTRGN